MTTSKRVFRPWRDPSKCAQLIAEGIKAARRLFNSDKPFKLSWIKQGWTQIFITRKDYITLWMAKRCLEMQGRGDIIEFDNRKADVYTATNKAGKKYWVFLVQ